MRLRIEVLMIVAFSIRRSNNREVQVWLRPLPVSGWVFEDCRSLIWQLDISHSAMKTDRFS
jgi:hypothetical protein